MVATSQTTKCMSLLLPAVLLVHSMSRQEGTKALYHAYNQLQTLSQQFTFPISTPAVVVVGQQTDGKSALIEALMGFQFNHVGGGTKTRRPIALQMQYRPECEEPRCFIVEGGTERQLRLPELRAYIEAENSRLEAVGAFEASELIIRIDFKYCPNLNIIDTPGMLTMAPSSPTSFSLPMQSTDSKSAGLSDAVRDLILNQIAPVERIILCVEETRCWESSQVRSLVVTVDPDFSRTVVVSTKLDTKFTQLSTASELRNFLAAADLHATHPKMLGGPFFTSVPIGRVGGSSLHGFSSDGEYQVALSHLEQSDMHYLWEALGVTGGTRLSGGASASNLCAAVGVSRLRSFLEQLLRERYLAGLNSINVQLKTACGHIAEGVREAESLLEDLSPDRLQGLYSRYVARFMERFEATWSGSMAPEILHVAQTIAQEHAEAGRMGDHDIQRLEGADCALFGGAQFIRLIREFEACVRTLPADPVSEEELCNTLGLDAQHDALHIGRTACGLALDHSFVRVRPLLEQLEIRLVHILGRMFQHAAAYAEGAMRLRSEPAREPHTEYAMRQLYGDDGLAFLRRPLEDAFSELLINSVKRCMQVCKPDFVLLAVMRARLLCTRSMLRHATATCAPRDHL